VRRLVLTTVVGLAAAFAALATAAAPSGPTLSEASARFPDRVYVLTLPKPQRLTTANVGVTENGTRVTNLAVTRPGASTDFGTILLIDASNSMRGKPIADEMKAARAFAGRNPNQRLGIISFNDQVKTLLPITANQAAIQAALAQTPENREGTHIYDALVEAADQLKAANITAGRIVMLSDGQEVRSTVPREVALQQLTDGKVRVFTIGLKSYAFDAGYLQTISSETGGTYAEATSSKELKGIYDALGFKLSNEYLLLWRSLAGPEKQINVAVRVNGYPQLATTSYTTPPLGLTVEPLNKSFLDKIVQSWFFMFLIVMAVVALVFWGIRSIVEARQRSLRSRMALFVEVGGHGARELDQEQLSRLERADKSLEQRGGRLGRFSRECEIGDVGISPTALLVGSIFGGLLLAVVLATLFSPWWLFAAFAPILFVRFYVKRKVGRVRKTFGEQLPDNLEVLGGALRAGHSLAGAFAVMADDAAPPSRKEFKRVVTDENLGIPMEESLRRVGVRMQNRDMAQVGLIALLQRETGSSSAEVIDQVAENVRGRLEIKRLVHVLTAQGRMARWIVSFMPLVLIVMILIINPSFIQPLFHTTIGVIALIVATIMVIMGSLAIKRIVEIKV
jgi:tight adherence protein B